MKNKLNYRLINLTFIILIIYFIYRSRNLWLIVLNTVCKIFNPFVFAFFIAYIIYPILLFFIRKKIPKTLGIFIIIFFIMGILLIISVLVFPTLFKQIILFLNYIITFLNFFSKKYDLNFLDIQENLYEIIKYIGYYLSNGTISFINSSINYITKTVIIFVLSIYFLLDMNKIRNFISIFFKCKNTKVYNCLKLIDIELYKYFKGFFKIMLITFFEYSFTFFIIGHPNAIILGILGSILGVIPYIGGIITNIIASVTSFIIGPSLFFRTLISFMILSIIDGYVINPLVYGKSNEIHPLIIMFSCFAGSILGGVFGMVIALPITIIITTSLKFYKNNFYKIKNKLKKFI